MAGGRSNPDYLNGVPELLILRLLSRKPMHGYELVQSIAALSQGRLEFGEGCVYPLLHRLESDGVLSSQRELVRGRSRVVYRILPAGKRRMREAASRWQGVVDAVQTVLQGGVTGHARLA
jgi:PadR family transcriptional regulator, regulatory protein PadR